MSVTTRGSESMSDEVRSCCFFAYLRNVVLSVSTPLNSVPSKALTTLSSTLYDMQERIVHLENQLAGGKSGFDASYLEKVADLFDVLHGDGGAVARAALHGPVGKCIDQIRAHIESHREKHSRILGQAIQGTVAEKHAACVAASEKLGPMAGGGTDGTPWLIEEKYDGKSNLMKFLLASLKNMPYKCDDIDSAMTSLVRARDEYKLVKSSYTTHIEPAIIKEGAEMLEATWGVLRRARTTKLEVMLLKVLDKKAPTLTPERRKTLLVQQQKAFVNDTTKWHAACDPNDFVFGPLCKEVKRVIAGGTTT